MPYQVAFTDRAAREVRALDRGMARRILAKIESLAEEPRPSGMKKLVGTDEEFYRVRVGDFRIVYVIEDQRVIVTIVRVRDRKDAFKNL